MIFFLAFFYSFFSDTGCPKKPHYDMPKDWEKDARLQQCVMYVRLWHDLSLISFRDSERDAETTIRKRWQNQREMWVISKYIWHDVPLQQNHLPTNLASITLQIEQPPPLKFMKWINPLLTLGYHYPKSAPLIPSPSTYIFPLTDAGTVQASNAHRSAINICYQS